jgi:hypothetical protein
MTEIKQEPPKSEPPHVPPSLSDHRSDKKEFP